MAGDKFKGLFDFINNFGDATVNVSVHEPASGIDHKERIFSGDVITMGGVDIVFSKDMLF